MIRIGSALFNADHANLAAALRAVEAAGVDFLHFDVFDGHLVQDLGFPPRTIQALRPLTALPFEVHLAAVDPLRFLPALARAGANLVFLPAEATPLVYEAIFAVREVGMRAGLCLALGTPLATLEPVLPLLDAVLLLGRVTGEGERGRALNPLLLDRVRAVRQLIDARGLAVDLQAAGGLETDSCRDAVRAGATSLPLGAALHREADLSAYVRYLRSVLADVSSEQDKETRRQGDKETRRQGDKEAAPPLPLSLSPASAASISPSPPLLVSHSPPLAPCASSSQKIFKVLVASRSFGPNCPAAVERMRAFGCELVPNTLGRSPTEDELLAQVADVEVIISGTEPLTARVLAAAPRLKGIAKHGVGYENIDLEAAKSRGIPVALAGNAIADSVADMAWALLLALARQVPGGDRAVRAGQWPRPVGVELRGKTLGVVGTGQIGKGVCRRAAGFGVRLVAHDLFPDAQFAQSWGVRYLPLDALLAEADFVSLHAPVTPETRGLINGRTLALMKPSAYLVNTARGELVDEAALVEALRAGLLAGAASDVFVKEPPGDNPLLALENFIATPHSAGQTHDGLRKMGEITADNALRILRGEEPLFRVA